MSTGRGTSDGRLDQGHRPALMLGLATVGFAINFWAWALLSPLAPRLQVTVSDPLRARYPAFRGPQRRRTPTGWHEVGLHPDPVTAGVPLQAVRRPPPAGRRRARGPAGR